MNINPIIIVRIQLILLFAPVIHNLLIILCFYFSKNDNKTEKKIK